MSRRATRLALIAALVLLGAGGVGQAGSRNDTALGANGELYTLLHGTFGELFGQPASPDAANPVLALEIRRPGAATDRILVADTGGADEEGSAALVYEESSRTLFVAWETTTNQIHSRIRLASYADGEWTAPIDVSDTRFSLKSSPQVAVTREAFKRVDAAGGDVVAHRTVLHVVWQEERAEGMVVVYAPLVLIDGVYTGAHAIVTLLNLVSVAPEAGLPVPLAELPLAPVIQRGTNDHSVVAGFVDPRTGALTTIELSLLSGEVSSLGDVIRATIIDIGNHYAFGDPGALAAFADDVRGRVIAAGRYLDGRVLNMIADDVRARILVEGEDFDGEMTGLGDVIRATIIDIGARLEARGLAPTAAQPGAPGLLDLSAESATPTILRFTNVASLGLPEMGAAPLLYVSPDGSRALIAWELEDRLDYRETRGAVWSEVASLSITELGRDRAYEILEARIRNR
jgi:hypothetical protein